MKRLIYIAILSLLAEGCTWRLTDGEGFPDRLFLYANVGQEDSCVVLLSLAPGMESETDGVLRNPQISVLEDGHPLPGHWIEPDEHALRYVFYPSPTPGTKYKISASADGIASVTSESIVPAKPQVEIDMIPEEYPYTMRIKMSNAGLAKGEGLVLRIRSNRMQEEYSAGYSYQLDAIQESIKRQIDSKAMFVRDVISTKDFPCPEGTYIPVPIDASGAEWLYMDLAAFDTDGTIEIQLQGKSDYDNYSEFRTYTPKGEEYICSYLKIEYSYDVDVCHVPIEYGSYYKARNAYHHDAIGSLGWASSFFAYSNIHNGLGLFAANSRETVTLHPPLSPW